jgi:hypothetical protein
MAIRARSPPVSRREFDYGLATYDRTHVSRSHRNVPRLSCVVSHTVVRQVFDGWQVSGITR